jgi:hypothetical protein
MWPRTAVNLNVLMLLGSGLFEGLKVKASVRHG